MAAAPSVRFRLLVLAFVLLDWNPSQTVLCDADVSRLSLVDESPQSILRYDYSPPSPSPAAPPDPQSTSSCEEDLHGAGSFDTLCQLRDDLVISDDLYIIGNGSFVIFPGVVLKCLIPGCSIVIKLSGELELGNKSVLEAGWIDVVATNVSLSEGSIVNSTGLAGEPPAQTSGTPSGIHGDGGGHGGRGASCYRREGQAPDDSWGGDAYSWSSLMKPESFGSKGGTTSREKDYGGGGGGRIGFNITGFLIIDGIVAADGGDGGLKGGGGSGGSIYIVACKM